MFKNPIARNPLNRGRRELPGGVRYLVLALLGLALLLMPRPGEKNE